MMSINDRIKTFKRDFARNSLYVSSAVLNRLPYPFVRLLTHLFIAIGFRCAVRQRRIAAESLQIAFGRQKTQAEIKKITRDCFENFGRGMIELIYFMGHPKMIKQRVQFEGKEYLDAALRQGNGVIAVSAHFGNFPLMLLRFAQEGYKTNAIIRPARDQKIEEYFFALRTKLGLNTIYSHPRKDCVNNSLKVLRNNEFLFIPLDQNFGSAGGVFVDFFGQKAATATGPVIFAMRAGAPLLPIFVIRQKDDTHKIIIDPPLYLQEGKDSADTIFINTARITQVIERYITAYPQEWGWMHRRWKSRPASEAQNPTSTEVMV
ncbi:MAG: lysophospholipid acyltransferase family protein [Candidatus Omnitrophota bacterium]